MSMSKIRASLGVLAAMSLAGAALAEPTMIVSSANAGHITRQQAVQYGDLDLASDTGRAQLDRRVRFAVADVCDSDGVMRSETAIAYLNCYSIALKNAHQQLNAKLAAVQTGGTSAVR